MRHNISDAADSRYAHMPVMWREVLDFVERSPGEGLGCLVDCTLGEGGHSAMLLERCPGLAVIGIERDPEILEIARQRLAPFGDRISFIHDNFANLARALGDRGGLDFFLYDLGVSSFHFDRSGRGFSYGGDERLDMRLDGAGESAYDVVNRYDQRSLADIFHGLGEERWSRRIAAALCREREKGPVETSRQLAAIVMRAVPKGKGRRDQGIHPATRVFQALRIHVNDELAAIAGSIREAWRRLAPGGRIMAIAFHSLEDREVKRVFRELARGCRCGGYPHCQCDGPPLVKVLTKKPLVPHHDEMEYNRRARSAKMRACERIESGGRG